MPKGSTSTAAQVQQLIGTLRAERVHHLQSLQEIDQTFKDFGISATAQRGPGRPKALHTLTPLKAKAAAANTPRKKAAPKKKRAVVAKSAAKKAGRAAKPASKARPHFSMTGDELILGFIKARGSATTAEIAQHWTLNRRGGKAENNLTDLVKAGKLKRTPLVGKRGSSYALVQPKSNEAVARSVGFET